MKKTIFSWLSVSVLACSGVPCALYAAPKNKSVSVYKKHAIKKTDHAFENIKNMIKKNRHQELHLWFATTQQRPLKQESIDNLLHYTVKNGSRDSLEILLKFGANPFFRIKGKTSGQYARELKKSTLIWFLEKAIKKHVHATESDLVTREPFSKKSWKRIYLTSCCHTPLDKQSYNELKKLKMLCPNCRANIFGIEKLNNLEILPEEEFYTISREEYQRESESQEERFARDAGISIEQLEALWYSPENSTDNDSQTSSGDDDYDF